MRHICKKWEPRGDCGIFVRHRKLSNLRFADDVLLMAHSYASILKMLIDLHTSMGEIGLKLHMGNTKVLSNVIDRRGTSKIMRVGPETIQVLPCDADVEYLGQCFSFADTDVTAMQYRIKKGWAAFHLHMSYATVFIR